MWRPFKNVRQSLRAGLGLSREGMIDRSDARRRDRRLPMFDEDPNMMPQFGEAAAGGMEAMNAARGQQNEALGLMRGAAMGQAPSEAEAMMAAANQQNVVNQMGMAAQGRGGNLAGQARQASAMGAASAMGTANQAAALRAQEMAAARNAYGSMSSGMADQGMQQYMGSMGMSADYGLGQRGLDLQQRQGNRDFGLGIMGGITGMGEAAGKVGMMFSDEDLKTNIRPGEMAASRAIGAVQPVTFQYKSPEYGQPGQLPGILAQDLEKTPEGAALVTNTPLGKGVDTNAGLGLALAASAEQEQRLRELEAQMGSGGTQNPFGPGPFGFLDPEAEPVRYGLQSTPEDMPASFAPGEGPVKQPMTTQEHLDAAHRAEASAIEYALQHLPPEEREKYMRQLLVRNSYMSRSQKEIEDQYLPPDRVLKGKEAQRGKARIKARQKELDKKKDAVEMRDIFIGDPDVEYDYMKAFGGNKA